MEDNPVIEVLIKLAERYGCSVAFKPLKYNDGRLKGKQILIREGMDLQHTVFILAHEIAHAALHYDKGDTINNPKHEEYEEQADRGAWLIIRAMAQN